MSDNVSKSRRLEQYMPETGLLDLLVGHVDRTKGLLVDGDNTLWGGKVAEGIGKRYLRREFKEGHYMNFLSGLAGVARVNAVVWRGGEINGNSLGLTQFYKELARIDIGTEGEMYKFAKEHITKHRIESVNYVLGKVLRVPKVLVTIGGSTSSKAAQDLFNLDGYVSNVDLFDSKGGLAGLLVGIRDGVDKLDAAEKYLRERYRIKVSQCTVIGDNANDAPLMRTARFSIASPFATREAIEFAQVLLRPESN